ncbi:MAG: aminoglycoside phosphotransferase [Chloroflexi bacterium]|nr:aminoglycoside phosphotransferase [Chloroflexota bacterium]
MTDDLDPLMSLHLLVPHPTMAAVLVQLDEDGFVRLPEVAGVASNGVKAIASAVAARLDHAVEILRVAPTWLNDADRSPHVFVETEPLPHGVTPAGCSWLRLSETGVHWAGPPEILASLNRWRAEAGTGTPSPRRPRWSRPGFAEHARRWAAERLAEAGSPAVTALRMDQLWGLSAIMRAETADGAVFLKSCARVFPTEPSITATVRRVAPAIGPPVLAADDAEGLLLMRDVGGTALGDEPPERWPDGLLALGDLQRSWRESPAAIELEDRGPARLAEILPALLEDPILEQLPAQIHDRLRARLPRLLDACHRIADLAPAPTIIHGDFHPWNVHATARGISIIDWSDSCLAHPFFDVVTYVGRTKDAAARTAMVAAYLDGWSDEGSRETLEEAAQLALPLGCLHQLESYRRILASLDPDDIWDLEPSGRSFAEAAVAWLDDGLDADVAVHT